jgi:pyrroline-5-carboxylate reductase
MNLGFVGTGAITSAMVTGLSSDGAPRHAIHVSPRNSVIAADLAHRFPSVSIAASNQDVLDRSEMVVLAVRPQIAPEVIAELRFRPDHRVVSLVSGLSLQRASGLSAPAAKVTRAVPLPSVAARRGPTVIYPADPAVADLFAALGTAFEVAEEAEFEAFCAATATMASYFAFADTIAAWLVDHGIPPSQARDYMARVFCGLANTAVDAPARSFEALAAEHATKGGINEQLLGHLREQQVFESLSAGMDAIMRRITRR